MFSKLFRREKRPSAPTLNDPDSERRLAALAAISEPTEAQLQLLSTLALNDPDPRVRRRAIEHLNDTSLLRKALGDTATAETAAARLVAIDPDITDTHPAIVTAQLNSGRMPQLSNLDTLQPQQLVELTIASRGDAQAQLLTLDVFQQAGTLTLLERASRDRVKNLNRFARDRLDALKRKRAECEEHHQRLQDLFIALEKHLHTEPTSAGFHDKHKQLLARVEDTFSALQSALADLALHGEEPVTIAALRQRIDALPVPAVAVEPATADGTQPAEDTADPFPPLVAEVEGLIQALHEQGDLTAVITANERLGERWNQAASLMQPSRAQQLRLDQLQADIAALGNAQQRLQRELVASARFSLQPTPPAQPEAAEDYWRGVAAARRWQRQNARLSSSLQWPQWAPVPESLSQLESQAEALRDTLAAIDSACLDIEKQLQEQIEQLSRQIDDGASKAAQNLLNECRLTLRRLPHSHADKFNPLLNQCAGRLGELKDWQTFATSPKREALCNAIAALADQPLAAPDQAARIKELRQQWRELGPVTQATDRALADRFNQDAQRAFETCRDYFTRQAELRAANLRAREEICSQLQTYLDNINWQDTNIKAAEQILRTARTEWRRFHPVDRKAGKPLEAKFEALQSSLHQQIKTQWEQNLALKQQIVADARALIESTQPIQERIESAKNLQQRWRDVGPTPRRPDQQLWQEFRSACDEVFALRDAEQQAADAAVAATQSSASALLDELAQLLENPTAAGRPLKDIEAEYRALPALPERLQRELDRRFDTLQHTHRSQQQAETIARRARELETQLLQDAIPGTSPAETTADDLRRLVVQAEIAAELESTPEDRDLRMELQVEIMNQRRGPGLFEVEPKTLVQQWLAAGSKPAGTEALRDRFINAVKALGAR